MVAEPPSAPTTVCRAEKLPKETLADEADEQPLHEKLIELTGTIDACDVVVEAVSAGNWPALSRLGHVVQLNAIDPEKVFATVVSAPKTPKAVRLLHWLQFTLIDPKTVGRLAKVPMLVTAGQLVQFTLTAVGAVAPNDTTWSNWPIATREGQLMHENEADCAPFRLPRSERTPTTGSELQSVHETANWTAEDADVDVMVCRPVKTPRLTRSGQPIHERLTFAVAVSAMVTTMGKYPSIFRPSHVVQLRETDTAPP